VAPRDEGGPTGLSGTYTTFFPGLTLTDTLVLEHDRHSLLSGRLNFVTLQDTGNWVQMGKHIALGVSTGPDAGVTMVGTRTPSGISSAEDPGVYVQPGSGVFQWYRSEASVELTIARSRWRFSRRLAHASVRTCTLGCRSVDMGRSRCSGGTASELVTKRS
jgi:hypothetical protein